MITIEQLQQILPDNENIQDWYTSLTTILPNYEITTNERIAAFLAESCHESANFTRLTENLNYKWQSLRKVFHKYFPTDDLAQKYEHNQEMIANRVYANRMGNDSEESGDGWSYKGRGIFQLTGKDNYQKFAESIGKELEEMPNFLETFDGAILSACWFWSVNNLNSYVDDNDIDGLSRRINGGDIGLEERADKYNEIISIIS